MSEAKVLSEDELADVVELHKSITEGDGACNCVECQARANLIATIRDRDRQIAELKSSKTELWDCPECGFTFDACHTDVDSGKHSCPLCAEHRLEQQNTAMRAILDDIAYSYTGVDVAFRALEFRQKARQALINLSNGH